jgi:predicted TIM-barrel fold metal-dependent hydrolase
MLFARMDIVDSQVHIGPGGAAAMVAAMNALGIQSVLNDEWWMGTAGDPGYRVADGRAFRTTSPTAELAAWNYPGRFSYLVRVDHRDPELRSVVRLARDSTYVRALRISPGINRAELGAFAAGEVEPVFAAAADNGLPIFVQIAGNTPLLAPYLKKFRKVRVIVCHCGMPPGRTLWPIFAKMEGLPDSLEYWGQIGSEPPAQAFDKVLRIAELPNVALKWAHAPNMFDAPGYPNESLRPFLRKALNAFGAERIMWASDISANQTGESWAELLFALRDNPELSAHEREYLLGRTARNWLDWDVSHRWAE